MYSRLIRVIFVGTFFGTYAVKLRQTSTGKLAKAPKATPANKAPLLIRYAVLSPSSNLDWVNNEGVPEIQSSICFIESNLVPLWWARFGSRPTYVLYTDNRTHRVLSDVIAKMPYPSRVFSFRNLDEENDSHMLAKYKLMGLNDINLASIRRQLADASLPANVGRLLIGTDITVLYPPVEFIDAVESDPTRSLYMTDRATFNGELYKVRGFDGPQCPGLLGDFFYLPPNANVTVANLQNKLDFYLRKPISEVRTTPDCESCHKISGGYQAADQFVWSLAVAEVSACDALSDKYVHLAHFPRVDYEVIHGMKKTKCDKGAPYCVQILPAINGRCSASLTADYFARAPNESEFWVDHAKRNS